ncbi:3'-5' RNA helicase YTHDC2 [Scaptodrosophila lebanonensis]|uniref:3'-5' RNA helicase YTHDC2 n=1 Tax=Drosophila lebanonensis TaxID=7225 RepID=A0A6J2TU33_DROLE|nr:3'-5' RNA helicase YTHDC2 [Scaptodrosophila lebanonensis]
MASNITQGINGLEIGSYDFKAEATSCENLDEAQTSQKITGTGAGAARSRGKGKTKRGNSNSSHDSNIEKAGENSVSPAQRQLLHRTLRDFLQSDEPEIEMVGLSAGERRVVHLFALQLGNLKTRSHGKDKDRVLVITRKQDVTDLEEQASTKFKVDERVLQYLDTVMSHGPTKPLEFPKPAGRKQNWGNGLIGTPMVPPRKALNLPRDIVEEARNLPIAEHRSEILQLLDEHQVLIVNGATGSGKSTQLPQFLLDDATGSNRPVRIVVTQPRRIAAITVSSRIAKERGEALGQTVGYQIRMENKCSINTLLTFTTGGCMMRVLGVDAKRFFRKTTHLIIDEVHERDVDTDFLMLAAKRELQRNRNFKLIMMSATMDLEKLSTYFNNAPIINVEGRCFKVEVIHLEDTLKLTGYMTENMKWYLKNSCTNDPQELLEAYLRSCPQSVQDIDNDLIISVVEVLLNRGQKGGLIIYLPGLQDITNLMCRFQEALPHKSVRYILLHSQIDHNSHSQVFRVLPNIQLKVILSTNIAQTSITIPDLIYVIDLGRAKIKTYDAKTDSSVLACDWISKADAEQRTGRAGRQRSGICYRLYSKAQYEQMSDYLVPEIMRRTLNEICLLAKLAAPNERIATYLGNALDPPKPERVTQACEKLQLIGVLHERHEKVTELGEIIAELPLDVQLGKFLIYSLYYRCFGSVSIIVSFFTVRDPFIVPTDRTERTQQQLKRSLFGIDQNSDTLGIVNLYKEYKGRSKRDAVAYCKENFLSLQSMDMFVGAVRKLRDTVFQMFEIHIDVFEYDTNKDIVRLAMAAGLYPNVANIDRSRKKRTIVTGGDTTVQISRNSCLQKINTKNSSPSSEDWICFVEKRHNIGQVLSIENNTLITTLIVAMQCGKQYFLQPCDSEKETLLCLDSWIRIQMDEKFCLKLLNLRAQLEREFNILVNLRKLTHEHSKAPEFASKLLSLHSTYRIPSAASLNEFNE